MLRRGEVTYAVRDTVIDDKEIREGNIMGIGDEGMLAVGEDIVATTVDMIKEMQDEDSEIVSIYFGEGITKEDADVLASKITEELPDLEVEVYPGGQPVYYYNCFCRIERTKYGRDFCRTDCKKKNRYFCCFNASIFYYCFNNGISFNAYV